MEPQRPGEDFGQRCFADPDIFDEQMAASQKADQGHADLILLSQHHLADLSNNGFQPRLHLHP
jgi:hypothetical protein